MKLKDYIVSLEVLAKKYSNLEVVYSTDDEGNSFHPVIYDPSIGHYDEEESAFTTDKPINACCIN